MGLKMWRYAVLALAALGCSPIPGPTSTASLPIRSASGTIAVPSNPSLRLYEWDETRKTVTMMDLDGSNPQVIVDLAGHDLTSQMHIGLDLFEKSYIAISSSDPNGRWRILLAKPTGLNDPLSGVTQFIDDFKREPGWSIVRPLRVNEPITIKVGDDHHLLEIDGREAWPEAVSSDLKAIVHCDQKTYWLDIKSGDFKRISESKVEIGFVPESGEYPRAIKTEWFKSGTQRYARAEFNWAMVSATDLEPRGGVFLAPRGDYTQFHGKPFEDVFFELPSWVRDGFTGSPPARKNLAQTSLQLFVVDKEGVWELKPDGTRLKFVGRVYKERPIPTFGLGGGGGESLNFRTEDGGVQRLTFALPPDYGKGAIVIGGKLAMGNPKRTLDTNEPTGWVTKGPSLTDGERLIDIGPGSTLIGVTKTGLAYLYRDGSLLVYDLRGGQLLQQVAAVEVAVWRR